VRLFAALAFSETTLNSLESILTPLRNLSPGLRWIPRENLHLTLRFFGESEPERVAGLMESAVAGMDCRSLEFTFNRMGSFGRRVLWIGGRVSPGVGALAKALGNPSFKPHVTIARPSRGADVPEPLDFRPISGVFHGMVLFESILAPGGAVYRKLGRWPQGCCLENKCLLS
jgi:2'-5' RNA ligase